MEYMDTCVEYHYELEDFVRKGEKIIVHKSVYIEGALPVHDHSFLEIFYILKGEGVHIINGERKPLKQGDLIFLSFHSFHTMQPLTDDFLWININFYPEFLDRTLIKEANAQEFLKLAAFKGLFKYEDTKSVGDITLSGVSEEFENLFIEMLYEYDNHENGYIENLKHLLIVVLTRIFRKEFSTVDEKTKLRGEMLVNLVLDEMKNKFNEHVSLNDLAKKAYTSPKYFSRIFKEFVGESLTDFVNRKRIEKACELLRDTDYSILYIMNVVGYNDSKYFYKVFKKLMGQTPREYKNNL